MSGHDVTESVFIHTTHSRRWCILPGNSELTLSTLWEGGILELWRLEKYGDWRTMRQSNYSRPKWETLNVILDLCCDNVYGTVKCSATASSHFTPSQRGTGLKKSRLDVWAFVPSCIDKLLRSSANSEQKSWCLTAYQQFSLTLRLLP